MSPTLAPEARRNVALFSGADFSAVGCPQFAKKKDSKGSDYLSVSDMPIFRSGVFRDSMGFQHTWDDFHMAQMVSNYELLKGRRIFEDVPVRKGHPGFLSNPMDDLIGYVREMRTERFTNPADGKEYTYILANYDILDPSAAEKVQSGLWKNRSSEVGFYLTNDDAEFWPVITGFAYVDIPAVEGLNFSKMPGVGSTHSVMFEKEAPVTTPEPGTPAAQQQNGNADSSQQNGTSSHGQGTPPPATPPPAPPAPHNFSVAGAPTSDYAAVQAHINMLETFRKETIENGRKNFVKSLAAGNKILATQEEGLAEFALSLSDDQYKKWQESFNGAPSLPQLGNVGNGTSNHNGNQGSPEDAQTEIDKGIVAQHRAAGMNQADLEKTPSFGRLKTKGIAV